MTRLMEGGGFQEWETKSRSRFGGLFDKYDIKRTGGYAAKYGEDIQHWDYAPPPEYFDELFRVSKNQIIFGGNYFDLPPARCFIIWDKMNISETFSMAMCEYAWTSFHDKNAKLFRCTPQGTVNEERFHPTQKPVRLYEWILRMFAKPGDRILDTHAGSASSLVACYRQGFDFMGFEIDEGYYQKALIRLNEEMRQMRFSNAEGGL